MCVCVCKYTIIGKINLLDIEYNLRFICNCRNLIKK